MRRTQLVAVGEYVCMIMRTSAAGVVVPVRPRPSVGIYFFFFFLPHVQRSFFPPFFQAYVVLILVCPVYKAPLWLC